MKYFSKTSLIAALIFFSFSSFSQKETPIVNNGVIDLCEWDFNNEGNVKLEGDWEFYWSKLLNPNDLQDNAILPDAYVKIPGVWTGTKIKEKAVSNTGYASYRLIVLSDKEVSCMLSFKEVISAYKVWFNAQEIIQTGVVSDDPKLAKPAFQFNKVIVSLKKGSNEIIVQISNYNHRVNAFESAPILGSVKNIEIDDFKADAVDLIAFGVLLIMAFYHLGLFFFRRKNIAMLIFSVFCFLALIRIMVSSNLIIGHFFPYVSWELIYILNYFTFYTIIPLMFLLIQKTFDEKKLKWAFNLLYLFSGIFLLSLFLPSLIYTQLLVIWEIIVIIYYIFILGGFLVKYVLKKMDGSVILLLSASLLAIATINDMLLFNDLIQTIELTPIGFFIIILGQSLTLGKRFTSVYSKNEELTLRLEAQNQNLNNIVIERTKQLEDERLKLYQSNKKLQEYFTAIEHASATIVITDTNGNITYANPQFEKVTGYTQEEVLGQNPRILKSGKTPEHVYIDLWKTIKKSRKVWRGEFINLKKNKEEFVEKVVISPIFNTINEIISFIAIKDDITELKKTVEALKKSEEKYRLIAENTSDIIWKIDLTTMQYSYISPSVFSMRGYTVEEAMLQKLEETFTPNTFNRAMSDLEYNLKILTNKTNFSFCESYQHWCKDGNIIDVEITANFIRNENGTPLEIIGITRDITKRVQIENELKRSEERLAKLLEKQSSKTQQLNRRLEYIYNNASNAIAFFDFLPNATIISSCNKLWANNFGFEPEDVEGNDISIIDDKISISIFNRIIEKIKREKNVIQEYFYLYGKHLQVFVFPILDEKSNEVISCAGFTYNISEKFEAELKVQETEQKFLTIFNNSSDAIMLMGLDLGIVEVNDGFANIYGSENYQSTNIFRKFIPKKYHKTIAERVEKLRAGESIPSFEFELIRSDDSHISVEMNSSLVNLNSKPMILSIIRDISSRKNMERTLTQVGIQIENRERRMLASDLHDNVGPLLSSMNMYLSVLALKPGVEPHADILNNSVRILKEAIASIREISNNLSPQVLSNFGLTSALNLFFETKKNLIDLKVENTLGDFRFSEIKETMIYNIIKEAYNNSLKYSQATLIELWIYKMENQITINYRDNGIGFDLEEKLSTIGTNLGLFNIINRVKILDGNYTINTSPGKGFALEIFFSIGND